MPALTISWAATSINSTSGTAWYYYPNGSTWYYYPNGSTGASTATTNYTPEELAAQERRLRERKTAVAAAEKLLHEHLEESQREALKEHGHFEVVGASGKRYRIERGHSGNIVDFEGRRRLCVHPFDVPDQDAMLAQKLWIETADEELAQIANAHPLRPADMRELQAA